MKKVFAIFIVLLLHKAVHTQTLQTAYDNGRIIQTGTNMPVVIKAGDGAHGLQIWEKQAGYGYLEFFNHLGGGPQRAIFGYDSRLNYEAPAHNFIGNIGIGNTNPTAKISFNNLTNDNTDGITWYSPNSLVYGIHRTAGTWAAPNYQQLRLSWDTGIILDPGVSYGKSYVDVQGAGLRVTSGDIGIGTLETRGYKLAVNGKIRAQEIKVEASPWPDYVFTKDYPLPTLQQTEQHINEKGHLPGIPSAAEVKANGIDLGEMNAKLLQKIEELTLHLIHESKKNAENQQRLKNQEKKEVERAQRIKMLEERLNKIENR
ncbi:hypothetical protein [Pedobacter heparinus]|uniref:hypothetical protein n=1 Tax=Pedobacter heparinus TaxID=984 RepID=UPI00292F4832|nr:hypothetical protein [Pedobacter heparinus]